MGTEGMRERSLELRKKDRLRLVFLHRTVQSSWKREGGRSILSLRYFRYGVYLAFYSDENSLEILDKNCF